MYRKGWMGCFHVIGIVNVKCLCFTLFNEQSFVVVKEANEHHTACTLRRTFHGVLSRKLNPDHKLPTPDISFLCMFPYFMTASDKTHAFDYLNAWTLEIRLASAVLRHSTLFYIESSTEFVYACYHYDYCFYRSLSTSYAHMALTDQQLTDCLQPPIVPIDQRGEADTPPRCERPGPTPCPVKAAATPARMINYLRGRKGLIITQERFLHFMALHSSP